MHDDWEHDMWLLGKQKTENNAVKRNHNLLQKLADVPKQIKCGPTIFDLQSMQLTKADGKQQTTRLESYRSQVAEQSLAPRTFLRLQSTVSSFWWVV